MSSSAGTTVADERGSASVIVLINELFSFSTFVRNAGVDDGALLLWP